ncbi:MAG: cellulose biosynthesis cyclic di-GMP-binding regulatory protein BcsB [Kofleriaceae bacterium]
MLSWLAVPGDAHLAPLTADEVVLVGDRPAFTHTVANEAAGPIEVAVVLRWSSELAPTSSVALTIDGRPIAVRTIAQLAADGHTLRGRSGTLPQGFHQVGVRAWLQRPEPTCERLDPDRYWMVVEAGSTVARTLADHPTLAAAVTQLQARRDTPVAVAIGDDAGADPATASVYVAADHAVRRLGGTAVRAAAGEPAAIAVSWGAPAAADGAVAEVTPGTGGLTITAVDAAGAVAALAAIADPRFVAACTTARCRVAGAPAPPTSATDDDRDVVRLDDFGYPDGFVASGDGDHVARLRWVRPLTITPRADPTLHLAVTGIGVGHVDNARSELAVTVNGRPVASFPLPAVEGQTDHLAVRIPAAQWQADVWDLVVTVRMRSPEGARCDADRIAGAVVIEPESYLRVPADRTRWPGLASLIDLTTDRRPVLVTGATLPWGTVAALAAVTAPFAAREVGRWQFAASCDEAWCLRVDTDLTVDDRRAAAAAAALPLDAAHANATIAVDGDHLRLRVSPLATATTPWPAPTYPALVGARAVVALDRWVALDVADHARTAARPAAAAPAWPAPVVSKERKRRYGRDGAWWCCRWRS